MRLSIPPVADRAATCHPDRKHWAKGLCKSCYLSEAQRKRNGNFLPADEYAALLKQQGGKCAICGRPESELKRQFAVDHDHETKQVRGLLCGRCNMGLGYFQDDIGLLLKSIRYLRRTGD